MVELTSQYRRPECVCVCDGPAETYLSIALQYNSLHDSILQIDTQWTLNSKLGAGSCYFVCVCGCERVCIHRRDQLSKG